MKVSAILTCAGKGFRAGFKQNKLLVSINGKCPLDMCVDTFLGCGLIDQIVITSSKEDFEEISTKYGNCATIVLGGLTRSMSVKNGLDAVNGDVVLIHDGARPFVSVETIKKCIEMAEQKGSAIPIISCADTVIKGDGKIIDDYLGKDKLYRVQTPQGFKTDLIKSAYEYAKNKTFNDDGEVYKNLFGSLYSFEGSKDNVKLTFKEDFEKLNSRGNYRFGCGFDCHRLVENRKLILGGIEIPHDKGLLGHSDADVLTHAIMDSILSACALRDIGYYFPDNDDKYLNANSINLLKEVLSMIDSKGFLVESISATIMAQNPKLMPHIPAIKHNLCSILNIQEENFGLGATTLEGLGFVGREEGICVSANAVVIKK